MLTDSNTAAPQSAPSRCSRVAGCIRPATVAGIFLVLFARPAAQTCFGADVTLEEVRAGYIQTVTSMPRIWTRCTSKITIPERRAKLMAEASSRSVNSYGVDRALVDWASDGLKYHYHGHSGVKPDGSALRPIWLSCDGNRVWSLEYAGADTNYALWYGKYQSLTTATDSALRIHHTPGKWLGLYFGISEEQQSGASLATLLTSGNPQMKGPEEIDGQLCYRIEMTFPSARPGDVLPVSVWFDPQVGYLPRRISNDFNGEAPPSDYRALSFRQVDVAGGDVKLWFPERMMIERRGLHDDVISTVELTLTDVRINEPLAADLFRPKLPADIPAFDIDSKAGVEQLRSYRTKEMRERSMAEYRAARANRVPTAVPAAVVPAIEAQAPGSLRWPTILIAAGLVMLIVSTIWTVRRPRDA